jgi:type IX secretion system PorP/SprF family membrane protein
MNLQKRIEFYYIKLIILQAITKILITFLLIVTANVLKAQDIHFSQYFNSPLSLNPAQTGNFDGNWRIVGNTRDQWRALNYPYTTSLASFDRQLFMNRRHFAVGGLLMHDRSGDALLNTNEICLSGAYHRTINNHNLSVGLQVGYVMKTIDQFSLPEDYNPASGQFEPKPNASEHLSYLDVNVGVGWRRKINKYEPEAGLAFFHINHPKESFFDDRSSKTPIRSVLYGSVKTELASDLYVKPGFMLYALRGSRDAMVGSQAGFSMAGNRFNVQDIYGGLYFRATSPSDALMAMLGIKVRNIEVNISYDINVSPLRAYTNNRGAFEISFIYKSISTIIKTFTIPCERI